MSVLFLTFFSAWVQADTITIPGSDTGQSYSLADDGNTPAVTNLSGDNTLTGTLTFTGDSTFKVDTGSTLKVNTIAQNEVYTLIKTGGGELKLTYRTLIKSLTVKDGTITLTGNQYSGLLLNSVIQVIGETAVLNAANSALGWTGKNGNKANGTLYLTNGGTLKNSEENNRNNIGYTVYMNNGIITSVGEGDSFGSFILDTPIYVQSGTDNRFEAVKITTRNYNSSLPADACGGVFDVAQNAKLTVTPRIMGSNVPLIKDGAGELVLTGVSTYTKATNVNAGKLILSGKGNLTGTSGVTVASGATLEFTNSNSDGEGGAVTFNRIISGAGNLVKSGTGTMELTAANSSFTGATTISGGTLKLTGEGTLGTSPVTVGANAALEINYANYETPVNFSSVTMTTDDVFNAGSAFKVPSGTVTFGTTDVALNNLSGGKFENGQITVPSSLTVAGKLTLNNDQLTKFIGSITAPVVEKTGLDTLQLCFDAQNAVNIGSLVVSSGRVDLKGYMFGNISVDGPNAVFSPGNSVGDAKFGGGYELKEGATLLIEQDETGIDTLTASSFVIDDNSILELTMGSVQPGASYPIIFNTSSEGFQGDLATDNFWNSLLTPESANYWNLSVVNGNTVYASIDANAVPEPSTWALLLLGAAGLLYVRKRTRK